MDNIQSWQAHEKWRLKQIQTSVTVQSKRNKAKNQEVKPEQSISVTLFEDLYMDFSKGLHFLGSTVENFEGGVQGLSYTPYTSREDREIAHYGEPHEFAVNLF